MKPEEIDQVLSATLDDRRLSRSERQALDQVLAELDLDADRRAFWRHRAFALARDTLRTEQSRQVLDWLEGVVKALQPHDAPSDTDVSVHFSPGDECVNSIVRLLHGSEQSVDICVYTITDDRLAQAILRAHARSVDVRVITDDEKAFDKGSDVHRLQREGVPVRTDQSEHHMHHKFAIFDQHTLLTGSYNWTRSAALYNRENVVTARDPRLIRQFQRNFDELWRAFA